MYRIAGNFHHSINAVLKNVLSDSFSHKGVAHSEIKFQNFILLTHMEKEFCLPDYNVYKIIWEATVGKKLDCKQEPNNSEN